MQKNIVIIGNGIAGITAARHIRKNSDHRVQIISSESRYFFSRTALMYVYMGHMRFQDIQPYEDHFWEKNRLELIHDYVEKIHPSDKKLQLRNGGFLPYDELIIATGSKPNLPQWASSELANAHGLYSKQDLESLEDLSSGIKRAVVVGGGLIGIELVEMLLSRSIEVDFIIREPSFWSNVLPRENADFVVKHMEHHKGLKLHFSNEIVSIQTDSNRVQKVELKDGKWLDCDFLGLCIGVSPNIDFLKSSEIDINRGVLVDEHLQTNLPHIYAIGDCAEMRSPMENRRSIEAVWYTGRMMGETLAQTLCNKPTVYNPGIWFNSAKFFDLEYQTYGYVYAEEKENEATFHWSDNDGLRMMSFRFNRSNEELIGMNTFGIRVRHEVLNTWLEQKKSISEVLINLASANFDPEFYKRFEGDILEKFNAQYQKTLTLAPKSWWRKTLLKS